MISKITDYKGSKIFGIYEDENKTFPVVSFGAGKAKSILEFTSAIQKFVNDNPVVKKAKKLTNAELMAQNAELLAQINAKAPVVSPAKK